MPIPTPHKHESKNDFMHRCVPAIWDEYKDNKGQAVAICMRQWADHKAKASIVVQAAGDEFVTVPDESTQATFPPHTPKNQPPGDKNPLPSNDQVQKDSDKPMPKLGPDDGGPIAPPKPEKSGDNPDRYDEVDVQAKADLHPYGSKCPICGQPTIRTSRMVGDEAIESCVNDHSYRRGDAVLVEARKIDPKPLPNIHEGGPHSAPNPDNSTAPSPDQRMRGTDREVKPPHTSDSPAPDSLDDKSAKPELDKMQWYMASEQYAVKLDPETGLAKWPLEFKKIEQDFHRPNKVRDPNAEPKTNQADPKHAVEIAEKDKPYLGVG